MQTVLYIPIAMANYKKNDRFENKACRHACMCRVKRWLFNFMVLWKWLASKAS